MKNLAIGLALSLAFTAQASAETTLRLTTSAPAETPWHKQILALSEALSENSGGDLQVEAFMSAQLGADSETVRQVVRGRIDMGAYPVTVLSSIVPEAELLIAPYVWESYEQAYCALDQHLAPVFEELLETRGLKLIGWGEVGFGHVVGGSDYGSLDQVDGTRLRATESATSKWFLSTIGAATVSMPFSEWPTALQTGLVEGGTQGVAAYVLAGIGDIAPQITLTQHYHVPAVMVMSERSWKRLSQAQQEAVSAAMTSSTALQELRAELRGLENYLLDAHVGVGGVAHAQSPEDRAEWAALVNANRDEMLDAIGGRAKELWPSILQAAAACK